MLPAIPNLNLSRFGLTTRLVLTSLVAAIPICTIAQLTTAQPTPTEPPARSAPQSAVRHSPKSRPIARSRFVCPTEVEPLTVALLRDLPSYLNRLYARNLGRKRDGMTYAIATNQPELSPLSIALSQTPNANDPTVRQVFFTVLERQYSGRRFAQFQHYHWLFLTQTSNGWQLALMFSRFGPFPANDQQPLTPPRESSQSLTALAVRSWLRDCQIGAVR